MGKAEPAPFDKSANASGFRLTAHLFAAASGHDSAAPKLFIVNTAALVA
jgi:hypothetical protein